jgi:hypothetical protein
MFVTGFVSLCLNARAYRVMVPMRAGEPYDGALRYLGVFGTTRLEDMLFRRRDFLRLAWYSAEGACACIQSVADLFT